MSKKKVLIVAAILVAGGAAIAVSAPGQRLQDRMMNRWGHGGGLGMNPGMGGFAGDWRGDLTREAFDEKVRERFARFDANSDGVNRCRRDRGGAGQGHQGPPWLPP